MPHGNWLLPKALQRHMADTSAPRVWTDWGPDLQRICQSGRGKQSNMYKTANSRSSSLSVAAVGGWDWRED
jgi:hypothetical protein